MDYYYDATKCWKYYDLATETWKAYPKRINQDLESMFDMRGMGAVPLMYKPGNIDAKGVEERELNTRPPAKVATHHVYFVDMIGSCHCSLASPNIYPTSPLASCSKICHFAATNPCLLPPNVADIICFLIF